MSYLYFYFDYFDYFAFRFMHILFLALVVRKLLLFGLSAAKVA